EASRLLAPPRTAASSMLIWMKPVEGENAVCDHVKLTEWFCATPRLWPQRISEFVWLTLTSVELPLVLLPVVARVRLPDTALPPDGVQETAPIVACAPSLPSSPMVNPAVSRVSTWTR